MPINPNHQRRALFTIQKGPRESDEIGSITLDGSSIEPADDDLILNATQKKENDFRRTQIIALLGLDTISSAEGFEDFSNYFKLRNVESEIVQGLVKSHLKAFDQFSSSNSRRRGRRSFDSSSVKTSAARYINDCYDVGKSYVQAFSALKRFESGITVKGRSSEGLDQTVGRHWSTFHSYASKSHKFFKSYGNHDELKPGSYNDLILDKLGLDMINERPTLQYFRLVLELESQIHPRTNPSYYHEQKQSYAVTSNSNIRGYATSFKSEGQALELNAKHIISRFRPGIMGTGGHPLWSNRNYADFAHLDDIDFWGAFIYVLDREMQLSAMDHTVFDDVAIFASNPRLSSSALPSDQADVTLADFEAKVDLGKKMLFPAATKPKKLAIEKASRRNDDTRYRIFHLENYGISSDRNSSAGVRAAPRQIFNKIMGTTSAAQTVGGLLRDKDAAIDHAKNIATTMCQHKQGDLFKHLGWFITQVSRQLESMLQLIVQSTPEHFESISDIMDGQVSGTGGSSYFDRDRFKSREARGLGEVEDVNWASDIEEDLARESVDQALNASRLLEELMETSNIPTNQRSRNVRRKNLIGVGSNETVGQTYRSDEGSIERVKEEISETYEAIQASLVSFAQATNLYDPGEAGVIHMAAGKGYSNTGWSTHRKNWGYAMITALMKMRNVSGERGKSVIGAQLYSRFRFGVFSYWTGDYDGLTSGKESLSAIADIPSADNETLDSLLQFRSSGNTSRTPGSQKITSLIGPEESLWYKGSTFGYIKGDPELVPKFKVPTSSEKEWYGEVQNDDLTESQQSLRGLHSLWNPNDPHSLVKNLLDHGENTPDVVSMDRDDKSKYFGIAIPAVTSEEYFELAWTSIGKLAAISIGNYCNDLKSSTNNDSGLSKHSGVGLDTLLVMWFEILGIALDGIPIDLTLANQFNAGSSKDRTILVEDMDLLAGSEDPEAQLLGRSMHDIFLAGGGPENQSAIENTMNASGINIDLDNAVLDLERALREQQGQASYNHDGGYREILNAANRIESAISRNADTSAMDKITELTLVIPTALKLTLPASSGDFKGLSSVGYLRAIGKALSGYAYGKASVQKYSMKEDQEYRSRAMYEKESAGDVLASSQATESYINACDNYLSRLSMYPSANSGLDLHRLGEIVASQHAYVPTVTSAITGIVATSKEATENAYENFIKFLNTASRGNLLQNKELQDRVERNFFQFDHSTHDRPLRTLLKLLPTGGLDIAKGAEGSLNTLSRLSCTSEFSISMKNIVISYLERYPIDDIRESIVAAGCAAGLDTKSLSVPKVAPLSSASLRSGDVDLDSETPTANIGPVRKFNIVATRDLAGDGEFAEFEATRYYHHGVFLLPESFQDVDVDDTTTGNFIRNIARQATWFTTHATGSIRKTSWSFITSGGSHDLFVLALDDMVESEILKYLIAMTTGVIIDQDLMFDRTHGFDPAEINIPGFSSRDVDTINRVEKSMRRPSTGLSSVTLKKALKSQDVSARKDGEGNPIGKIEDPSWLGKWGTKKGLVTNEDALSLTVSTFKSVLDPDTGEEIRIPIKSDAEPWNLRLLSSLSNAAVYKAKSMPSSMLSSPLFDYILISRMKSSNFPSGTSPVDLISYSVQIGTAESVKNYRKRELPRNGSQTYNGN